jgi:hypothetical protein
MSELKACVKCKCETHVMQDKISDSLFEQMAFWGIRISSVSSLIEITGNLSSDSDFGLHILFSPYIYIQVIVKTSNSWYNRHRVIHFIVTCTRTIRGRIVSNLNIHCWKNAKGKIKCYWMALIEEWGNINT